LEETSEKLFSSLLVKKYGRGMVNIIGQISVRLPFDTQEYQVTILVQRGAPLDLLLGTDLLSQFGFCVALPQEGGRMTDLLRGGVWDSTQCISPSTHLGTEAPSFVPAAQGVPAKLSVGDSSEPQISSEIESGEEMREAFSQRSKGSGGHKLNSL